MQFELKTFENGTVSVLDHEFGETMHSIIGPTQEARQVYLEQAQIQERFLRSGHSPLVIFDVGLGIGTNALACLNLIDQGFQKRDLHLVSFEINPLGLEFALQHPHQFPFIQDKVKILTSLLENKYVSLKMKSGFNLQWDLILGDFRKTIFQAPSPEVIFYDFYSPKICPELWNLSTFKKCFQATAVRRKAGLSTFLCTYTTSTAARTALMLAGFYVGKGISTGWKIGNFCSIHICRRSE